MEDGEVCKMDVLFFAGQSNMEGQTESLPADCSPVEDTLEYHFLTDSFVPLCHPAGEDVPPMLSGANDGHGSLLPDFCRAYRGFRPVQVAAVHTARGATTIDDWVPGGTLYLAAAAKQQAALRAVGKEAEHIYFVWLQGESDAVRGLSEDAYLKKLIDFKNALKRDCLIEKFGIIRVGYFTGGTQDEAIMSAQERAAREDTDFLMLTAVTARLSKEERYLNPEAAGHYNNAAMAVIGREAGAALGRYAAAADKSGS